MHEPHHHHRQLDRGELIHKKEIKVIGIPAERSRAPREVVMTTILEIDVVGGSK